MRYFLSLVLLISFPLSVYAADLPAGYHPVSGTSSYSQSADGKTGTLTATSNASIGEWAGGFNVGAGKTFTANLPAGGVHLSRDITANPSDIFGVMNVPNGRFFLINTNGVIFAPGAQVNAAGLVASSLDIQNSDFLAGNYNFSKASGKSPSLVSNAGTIAAGDGGVALIGGAVRNQGTITTTTGSVLLAAGEAMTLDLGSNISVVITTPASSKPAGVANAVQQDGVIRAGRNVTLTAEGLDAVFDKLVNVSSLSTTEAGIAVPDGQGNIELRAASGNVTVDTSRVNPHTGGTVTLDARQVNVTQPLDGPYALKVFADEANLNSGLGLTSPLESVEVEAGTIHLADVATTGSQTYTDAPVYNGGYTSGFETDLDGNLTTSGDFGNIFLRGATRLNKDVTLTASGNFTQVVLGYSVAFYPGNLDGPYHLTLEADRGDVRIEDSTRFGGYYGVGTPDAPLAGLKLTQADTAEFGLVNMYAKTIDLTANTLSLTGHFETFGAFQLVATHLSMDGTFATNGGSMSLKAASTRLAGSVLTSGGGFLANGPVTFAASYLSPSGEVLKPYIETGLGGFTVLGAVNLDDDTTVSTLSGGNILFNSTINGDQWGADDLTLSAGTGNIDLKGGIGYNPATGQGTRIGRLSIHSARNVTFYSYVSATSLYQQGSVIPGTTQFVGPVDAYQAEGIDLNGYNFMFDAPVKTSNGGTFTVTNTSDSSGTRPGTLTTTANADFTLDGAFLNDGAGVAHIAGDIRTTNDNITFLRPVTLTGDVFMGTGSGAGNIRFGNTLYGTTSGQEDLTLNAGTGNINFDGQVGYNPDTALGVRLGRLEIQNVHDWTAANIITAASILQDEGTGATRLRGLLRTNQSPGIRLTGNGFVLNGAAATGGQIAVNYRDFITLNGVYTPTPIVRKRS